MDEFKDKKRKLLGIKKQILSMPNNMIKARNIDGYTYLLRYLLEIDSIKSNNKEYEIDDDFVRKYDRNVINATQRKINEIHDVAPILYSKYNELIEEYKNNGFCSFELYSNDRINQNELYEYMFEYINLLGEDVCNLYNSMVKGGNIYIMPYYYCLGVSMNTISVDNPCMIIDNVEGYFDFYATLLHELGHCYQFYLQRNHTHLETFNPFSETTSLLFEKMFCEFLKSKNQYQKILSNYELNDHIYFLNDISISKVLCALFIQHDIDNINAYDLSYNTRFSLERLLYEAQKDCGYIMENKLDMALTEFHYSLGNIFATYFIEKMKKDFTNSCKEYKDFICMADNYPLYEILDKYFDVSLMKNNIKSFIKNYRSR